MPAPWPPADARIQVATTQGGAYADVGFSRTVDMTEGVDGDTTIRWFGGDQAVAGNDTIEGSIDVWWDMEDTDGQEILKTAKRNGTTVWFHIAHEGTDPGDDVEEFEARITEINRSFDRDGDALEGSFSFIGTPSTFSVITLA